VDTVKSGKASLLWEWGFFVSTKISHNPPMNSSAIVALLQAKLPHLMAVYAFGSRIKDEGAHATTQSDLDLAVLVEAYADPIQLFELTGQLSDLIGGIAVDLVDARVANGTMQYQILTQGQRWWSRDYQTDLWEIAMLTEKMRFDEKRQPMIQDILKRGSVYGR
jgi:predicted nucleotidyltransferase